MDDPHERPTAAEERQYDIPAVHREAPSAREGTTAGEGAQTASVSVTSDEYAIIVAEKAAKMVEDRRRTTTRVIVAGLASAIAIVSYLGVSNLRGLVIEEVRAQVKPFEENFSRISATDRESIREALQIAATKAETSTSATNLTMQIALRESETRTLAELETIRDSLSKARAGAELLGSRLDDLDAGIEARLRADRESITSATDELRTMVEAQGEQLTFLTLSSLLRELEDSNRYSAKQRDAMVSSVLTLSRSKAARDSDEYATAVASVVSTLSGGDQNEFVDDIDRALWPHLEVLLAAPRSGNAPSAELSRWRKFFTENAHHYGKLLLGGAEGERAEGSEVDRAFERYRLASARVGYPEIPLSLEVAVAFARGGGRNEHALLIWDKVRDLSTNEKRYVIVDVIEKTDELAWRTKSSTLGKRVERVYRDLWIALEPEFRALLADPEVRSAVEDAANGFRAEGRLRPACERVLAGNRPWE